MLEYDDAQLDLGSDHVLGAYFNSGQSCCAVEVCLVQYQYRGLLAIDMNSTFQRIYVYETVYDEFVSRFIELVKVCLHSGS